MQHRNIDLTADRHNSDKWASSGKRPAGSINTWRLDFNMADAASSIIERMFVQSAVHCRSESKSAIVRHSTRVRHHGPQDLSGLEWGDYSIIEVALKRILKAIASTGDP